MLNKLAEFIMKRPMKIILGGVVVFIALLVGATQVELKTGNDTLIQEDTQEYIDNFEYQAEFGSDPIIIMYQGDGIDNLLTVENIAYMNELEEVLSYYDEIFTINSPVSLVKEFAGMQATEFEGGLLTVSSGLADVATNLTGMSDMMLANANTDDIDAQIEQLTTAINGLITGQEQLGIGVTSLVSGFTNYSAQILTITENIQVVIDDLDTDPLLATEVADLQAENDALITIATEMSNIATNSAALPGIADNTVLGLQNILLGLTDMVADQTIMTAQLTTLATSLAGVADGLQAMSTNLGMIYSNFNILEPSIPTEQSTLDMMVYEDGVIRPVFESFLVGDQNMMFLVVLKGGVSDEKIGDIIDSINETLEAQGLEDVTLVSGKPVLDQSIKSEMMGSMQVMMALSALIMVVVLLIVFRIRWSLLPLVIILFAVIATIGIMGWLNIGLTMVSMAVFPVLIGLGIDYSIQFQSRYTEELAGGMENE
ncbi:MAG: MMPL family protein [Candidatus Izimaplasma bacterium HR2]|nr:MAG: MMPL family protein [Candidatus Izimaplasma bacterium HR2]